MAKEVFDSIMAGIQDALAYARGDKTAAVVSTVRHLPRKERNQSSNLCGSTKFDVTTIYRA